MRRWWHGGRRRQALTVTRPEAAQGGPNPTARHQPIAARRDGRRRTRMDGDTARRKAAPDPADGGTGPAPEAARA
ncbi:hypothetical protein GCM10023083_84410 [Streptomyces phyllanthi]